jgi:ATP synthase protein I
MSSRTENDDPWRRHGSRTAAGGPRQVLPAAADPGAAGMTGRGGPAHQPPPVQEQDGWRILSYLLGGMILYGGIGWLIGHWTGISVLFPIGMLLGLGLAITMIILRFTRS